jgi:hypothetical protein
MASSSPIALSSTSTSITNPERRYGGLLPPRSIKYSERSPKRHAHLTDSDVFLLNEASRFLKVSAFTDVLGDWQYGGIRTRSQTRIDQARKRRAARNFRTPPPQPSPPNTTAKPFTAYLSGERYDGTLYASAPKHELPVASPCERTLCIQRRREFRKHFAGKRLRLSQPRPPRRIRLTTKQQPSGLKIRFPANVVARNRAMRLAQAALEVLSASEVSTSHTTRTSYTTDTVSGSFD